VLTSPTFSNSSREIDSQEQLCTGGEQGTTEIEIGEILAMAHVDRPLRYYVEVERIEVVEKPALVIIPCYNEEVSIADTIRDINNSIQNCEIWVIDNNSTDRTASIALNFGVKVFFEPRQGKGFAVRRAISKFDPESFRIVFMTDGDHTYSTDPFAEAENLILNGSYDLAVGRRIDKTKSLNVETRHGAYRLGHVGGNRLLSFFFKYLFKMEIPDTLSGWRVMSVGYFSSFTGGVSGFQIETELNAHAYRLNANVTTVEVPYIGRKVGSESKLSTYKDGIKILFRLIALFQAERPFVAYGCISLFPLLASSILLMNVLNDYFTTHKVLRFPSLIASVGGFLISILLLATGIILQNVRLARVEETRRAFVRSSRNNRKY
jgi:glycosyltransferase involved in cell wall biosynthesis